MPDTLVDRIRAELNGLCHGDSPAMPIAAMEAVLDLHRSTENPYGETVCGWCSSNGCGCCRYTPDHTPPAATDERGEVIWGGETYPCAEVLVIAKAMGIEEGT